MIRSMMPLMFVLFSLKSLSQNYDSIPSAPCQQVEIPRCLEQVIGDRVYLNPTIKKRWTNRLVGVDNKPMKRGMSRQVFDGGVEWKIVFNKDGTYKISY